MNRRNLIIGMVFVALTLFGIAAFLYKGRPTQVSSSAVAVSSAETPPQIDAGEDSQNTLVRPHSPVIGPDDAAVTIVEFFDPSCESCRAFFPTVEGILEKYPKDVKVVLRYAPFHQGSDEAVAILEAARRQNLLLPVLTILLERQPQWAVHGAPNLDLAWDLAAQVGMDVEKGRQDAKDPSIAIMLQQDMADIKSNAVQGTPSFFINGDRLTSFGQQQLIDAVDAKVLSLKGAKE